MNLMAFIFGVFHSFCPFPTSVPQEKESCLSPLHSRLHLSWGYRCDTPSDWFL